MLCIYFLYAECPNFCLVDLYNKNTVSCISTWNQPNWTHNALMNKISWAKLQIFHLFSYFFVWNFKFHRNDLKAWIKLQLKTEVLGGNFERDIFGTFKFAKLELLQFAFLWLTYREELSPSNVVELTDTKVLLIFWNIPHYILLWIIICAKAYILLPLNTCGLSSFRRFANFNFIYIY